MLLWPICEFVDAADAADAFWRAYPHAPDGEHLGLYIQDIATEAERRSGAS